MLLRMHSCFMHTPHATNHVCHQEATVPGSMAGLTERSEAP